MNIISQAALSRILVDKFRNFGFEKELGNLSIKEIDEISKTIIQHIISVNQEEEEPPF